MLLNSQILGSSSSVQERRCGHCPAPCLALARTERAVPVLGQLDLSDLLQVALMIITLLTPR